MCAIQRLYPTTPPTPIKQIQGKSNCTWFYCHPSLQVSVLQQGLIPAETFLSSSGNSKSVRFLYVYCSFSWCVTSILLQWEGRSCYSRLRGRKHGCTVRSYRHGFHSPVPLCQKWQSSHFSLFIPTTNYAVLTFVHYCFFRL